ncbi:MAG: DUF4198 domain-containing protein [Armatimonadetes bacterium]|nr:DUF4198 domain-containing protein [Armatimonadota bacterium]
MIRTVQGRTLGIVLGLALMSQAKAHDIWIEASSAVCKVGQEMKLSLMLGNHGNHHRDFALRDRIPAGRQQLLVLSPDGSRNDLTSKLQETMLESKTSYWSTGFAASKAGGYQLVSTFDQVMSYAPVRDIKCAKSFLFVKDGSSRSSRKLPKNLSQVGSPFELVPVSDPFESALVGSTFKVQLLFKGKPMRDAVVSFIPKGVELKGDLDPAFEFKTDGSGIAGKAFDRSGQWLIVAHFKDSTAKGTGYDSIGYSATIHLIVAEKPVTAKR